VGTPEEKVQETVDHIPTRTSGNIFAGCLVAVLGRVIRCLAGPMEKLPRWLAARIPAGVYSSVRTLEPGNPAGDSEPSGSSIRLLAHTDWTFEIALFQHRPLGKQIPFGPLSDCRCLTIHR
jgi:hypothetical protein